VAFMERNHVDGRVFNTYHFGGYLLWRRWPANLVMIDGRYDAVLFDEALLEKYFEAQRSPAVLDQLTASNGVEILVLDTTANFRLRYLDRHPRWARVYWDGVSEVFVLREGRFAQLAKEHEYRLTRPEEDLNYLVRYRGHPETWGRALAELRRATEDNPANTMAWLGLAQEYATTGPADAERRLKALNRAAILLARAPGLARARGERSDALLQLGRLDEAATEANESLRLQNDLLLPRWVLATVSGRRGEWRDAREHLRALLSRLESGDPRVAIVQEHLKDVERRLSGTSPQ